MPSYPISIDWRSFYDFALQPHEWFNQFGQVTACDNGLNYIFQDNGKPRLLVAHLDSVASHRNKFYRTMNENGDPIVVTPTLDDRIGAFIILDVLKKAIGDEYDILLTDGEESGQDTVYHFMNSEYAKNVAAANYYNWIAEFDRMGGKDCAMYGFMDTETSALVAKYGWTPTHGSFTDIAAMEDLNCKGFNFCTGYEDYHSEKAWANLSHTASSVAKFIRFFNDMKDTRLPHVKSPVVYRTTGYGTRSYDDWDNYDNFGNRSITRYSSSSSTSSQNPKILPPLPLSSLYKDNQFDWVDLEETVVTPVKKGDLTYNIYHERTSKRMATYCLQCATIHWVEQLVYPDGIPMCAPCFVGMEDISPLDKDWIKAGGIILVNMSAEDQNTKYTRSVAYGDKEVEQTEKCDVCGQLEWKSKITIGVDGHTTFVRCQKCAIENDQIMNDDSGI